MTVRPGMSSVLSGNECLHLCPLPIPKILHLPNLRLELRGAETGGWSAR